MTLPNGIPIYESDLVPEGKFITLPLEKNPTKINGIIVKNSGDLENLKNQINQINQEILERHIEISDLEFSQLKSEVVGDLDLCSFVREHYEIPYHLLPYYKFWHDEDRKVSIFWFRNRPFKVNRR